MSNTSKQRTRKYGYCHISTKHQNEDRQLVALEKAGVERRYKTFLKWALNACGEKVGFLN